MPSVRASRAVRGSHRSATGGSTTSGSRPRTHDFPDAPAPHLDRDARSPRRLCRQSARQGRSGAHTARLLAVRQPRARGHAPMTFRTRLLLILIEMLVLPDVYAVSPRVNGGPGLTPLGYWRFDNLGLEATRP